MREEKVAAWTSQVAERLARQYVNDGELAVERVVTFQRRSKEANALIDLTIYRLTNRSCSIAAERPPLEQNLLDELPGFEVPDRDHMVIDWQANEMLAVFVKRDTMLGASMATVGRLFRTAD